MTSAEKNDAPAPSRLPLVVDIYARLMSAALMVLGLRQWAIILGVISGPTGSFEQMSSAWQVATMHLAVVDLVASVGLWQRVAWGNVVWIYAALAEVVMHTAFIGTYGADYPLVAFHLLTIAIFLGLTIAARRAAPA